jgi:predicted kinase
MVRKPHLYMLVGVPGSGKSTWIGNQVDHVDAQEDLYIASTDNYIETKAQVHGTTYNAIFKDVIKDAEKMMYEGVMNAVKHNHDIIWDQTNLTRRSRAKKLIMIPDYYKKYAVVFPTPEETELQRRLASRPGKTIPEYILGGMIEAMEKPETNEGFDTVLVIDEDVMWYE